jgi:hypothetical protein
MAIVSLFVLLPVVSWNTCRYGHCCNCFVARNFHEKLCVLPQNGIPCGTQVPFVPQIRLAGPKSSNPRSQVYLATVPGPTLSVLNSTVL